MDLIEKLIARNDPSALQDAFELIRELELNGSYVGSDGVTSTRFYDDGNYSKAHSFMKELRTAAAKLLKQTGDEELALLYKRGLLFDARNDFDCAFRYAEWNREPRKRFYEPRRKQLLPIVRALQRLEERKIHRLLVEMPPGAGKSGTAIGFLVWTGMRHPDLSILGVSNNNGFLRGAYDEVERMLDPKGEYLWAEILFP